MIRTLLFILILFSVASCSKSTYYAYEKNGDYCTLEVTKKGDVIYRAFYSTSENKEIPIYFYGETEPLVTDVYIYIYTVKIAV